SEVRENSETPRHSSEFSRIRLRPLAQQPAFLPQKLQMMVKMLNHSLHKLRERHAPALAVRPESIERLFRQAMQNLGRQPPILRKHIGGQTGIERLIKQPPGERRFIEADQ